jgi:hypothetical protein
MSTVFSKKADVLRQPISLQARVFCCCVEFVYWAWWLLIAIAGTNAMQQMGKEMLTWL